MDMMWISHVKNALDNKKCTGNIAFMANIVSTAGTTTELLAATFEL